MILFNQNKTSIFNMDRVSRIYYEPTKLWSNDSQESQLIHRIYAETENGAYVIGEYENEEAALTVLSLIAKNSVIMYMPPQEWNPSVF